MPVPREAAPAILRAPEPVNIQAHVILAVISHNIPVRSAALVDVKISYDVPVILALVDELVDTTVLVTMALLLPAVT